MFTYDSSGNLLTEDAEPGADASYRGGLAFNPVTGALYIGGSGGHSVNGLSVDGKGRVQYDSGAPAVYHHGWPLSAVGAIIAQTGAIAAGTPFINGAFIDGSGIFVSDAGGWDPSALFASSEVGVWYDPSDLSTMWTDDGTTQAGVGDLVYRIDDKSGNGFHAKQTTEASRPALRQTAGGLYYLEFDGTDDFLVTAAIDFSVTDKMSLFIGVQKQRAAGFSTLIELGTGSTTDDGFSIFAPSNTNEDYDFRLDANERTTGHNSYLAPSTNVLAVSHNLAGTTAAQETIVRIDASAVALTGASVSSATAFGNQPLYIGRRGGTTLPFDGFIYSLIVRGALSDATEIDNAEAYVNGKTGAY